MVCDSWLVGMLVYIYVPRQGFPGDMKVSRMNRCKVHIRSTGYLIFGGVLIMIDCVVQQN